MLTEFPQKRSKRQAQSQQQVVDQRESSQNSKKDATGKMKKEGSSIPTIEKVVKKRVKASTKSDLKSTQPNIEKAFAQLMQIKEEAKEEVWGYEDHEIQTEKFSYIPGVHPYQSKEENEL